MSTPGPQSNDVALRRPIAALVVALVLLSACARSDEQVMPTRDEVIAANVEAGLEPAVAECLVGIGQEEVSLDLLMPDAARAPLDDLLISELTDSCGEAAEFVGQIDPRPERLAFEDGPFTYGEDPALDALWDGCVAGAGTDCDTLWVRAPIGSEYERFGVSCGDRPQVLDCAAELTPETVEELDAAARARAEETQTTDRPD